MLKALAVVFDADSILQDLDVTLELDAVFEFFASRIDVDDCRASQRSWRRMIKAALLRQQRADAQAHISVLDVARHSLQPDIADGFPGMSFLAQVALSIPITSAPVERGFSQVKLIKTELRNRLSDETLLWLLMVSLNGPDFAHEDDDFKQLLRSAVSRWLGKRERREIF